MKNDKDKPKKGRPKAQIDWDKVKKMAQAGCTIREVAQAMGIYCDTLHERFMQDRNDQFHEGRYTTTQAYFQDQRSGGNAFIKLKQFELAIKKGDRNMLVWLGKNRLGQSDKKQIDSNVKSVNVNQIDISKLDGKQLEQLEGILRKSTIEDNTGDDKGGES